MIVIGLIKNISNDAELKALTGLAHQEFIYHTGTQSVFTFRNNADNGDFQADNLEGWFIKDTIKALTLSEYKDHRFEEINERSRDLIANGHVYNGNVFSLSENAQRNLLGLFSSKDYLNYPFEYRTKNDLDKVFLNNATDITNFYFSAMGTIQQHLGTGNALKQQVKDCTTELEVQAIIDNR